MASGGGHKNGGGSGAANNKHNSKSKIFHNWNSDPNNDNDDINNATNEENDVSLYVHSYRHKKEEQLNKKSSLLVDDKNKQYSRNDKRLS